MMIRRIVPFCGLALLTLAVASCSLFTASQSDSNTDAENDGSASSAQAVRTMLEGTLEQAGPGIYMQGSHTLTTDDGQRMLLESSAIDLDQYVGQRVSVTGDSMATVEEGGTIVRVDAVESLSITSVPAVEATSSSTISSEEASSSEASSSSPVSSAQPSSSAASAAASAKLATYAAPSSDAGMQSSVIIDAESSSSPAAASTTSAMAKASVDETKYTQRYCTGHIGFCIPIHKNWYYKSFGAAISPYLWHVEIGDQAVDEEGQGLIMVNLMEGALAAGESEGKAIEQGEYVVASRQWTGNRHFEISAPKDLASVVEYLANHLETYQSPEQ